MDTNELEAQAVYDNLPAAEKEQLRHDWLAEQRENRIFTLIISDLLDYLTNEDDAALINCAVFSLDPDNRPGTQKMHNHADMGAAIVDAFRRYADASICAEESWRDEIMGNSSHRPAEVVPDTTERHLHAERVRDHNRGY